MTHRVLVVDDDGLHLAMVRDALQEAGFEVDCLTSAIGVSAHARQFQPDVVLLDLHLPALSGDRLIPLIRRQPGLDACRVLLYSAEAPEALARAGRAAGADGWVAKGDLAQLVDTLRAPSLSTASA